MTFWEGRCQCERNVSPKSRKSKTMITTKLDFLKSRDLWCRHPPVLPAKSTHAPQTPQTEDLPIDGVLLKSRLLTHRSRVGRTRMCRLRK